MQMARWVVFILAVSVPLFWLVGQWAEDATHERRMSRIPARLAATSITYSAESGGDIGPGANEGGLSAYALPASTLAAIEQTGITFLLDPDLTWHPTPIGPSAEPLMDAETRLPDIHGFIGRYIRVDLDPVIEHGINDALQTPGSFYAFPRTGKSVIIVIPTEARAYFGYNG